MTKTIIGIRNRLILYARNLLFEYHEHPDAIRLNEVYEKMPVEINLKYLGLPSTSVKKH